MHSSKEAIPPAADDLLAAVILSGLVAAADPSYVAGTVRARKPGKQVLGVRIPALRTAVQAGWHQHPVGVHDVVSAATRLWTGETHEEELAACMLLTAARVPPTAQLLREWSPLLDNWLSVDEFGGVIGKTLTDGQLPLTALEALAGETSPWSRRLYVRSLIAPVVAGLDPAEVAALPTVMQAPDEPVRKATIWLLREIKSRRPDAAHQLWKVWPDDAAAPLTRRLRAITDA